MAAELRYGLASSLLEVSPDTLIAHFAAPRGEPLADVRGATAAALASPVEFPPLAESAVPGDRVVLALDRDVPRAGGIVAAVVEALMRRGVEPEGIVVLLPPTDDVTDREDPRGELLPATQRLVALATHQPAERDQLAFLSTGKSGRPILVNRTLFDADLVLPIGALACSPTAGYHGIHGGWFPGFADRETAERFTKADAGGVPGRDSAKLTAELDEAAWLLGLRFTIQALPGGPGEVLAVLAGDIPAVAARGQKLAEAAWRFEVPRKAGLVVASLPGDARVQTWANVGKAAVAALPAAEEGAPICLCTEIDTQPGPAILALADSENLAETVRRLRQQPAADLLAASHLAYALERSKVYLLSRLDESLVEDLGLTPLSRPSEVERLIKRSHSYTLLENAPRIVAASRAVP